MPSGTIFFHRLFLHFDYFLALFSALSRANSSSASMASLVKELFFHQLIMATTTVIRVLTSCWSCSLSMGSGLLLNEASRLFSSATIRQMVLAQVAALAFEYFYILKSSCSGCVIFPQRQCLHPLV